MSDTALDQKATVGGNSAALATVCIGTIILPLSITGMGVAMPRIGASLHADLTSLQWALNGYSLVFTSLLLACGSLADVIGRRRLFRIGVTIFGIGSVMCAVSGNAALLETGRVVAGIGGAAAVPSGAATLAYLFQGPSRAKAFGLYGTTLGVGLAIGPSASGILVSSLGWRAVFALPAVAAFTALAMSVKLPESRNPAHRVIDWTGTVLFSVALFALTFAIIEGPQHGWTSVYALGGFAAALVLLVVFAVVERGKEQPMLDISLLANPRFLGLSIRVVITVFAFSPLLAYFPSFLTSAKGYSPQQAGLIMLLMTAPIVVLPTVAGLLAKWIQPFAQIVLILAVGGAGLVWMTTITPSTGLFGLVGPMVLYGISMGISFGLSDATVLGSVPAERAGMASGLYNTMRLAGETLGMAVLGSLLVAVTQSQLNSHASELGQFADRTGDLANAMSAGELETVLSGQPADQAAVVHSAVTSAYTSALHSALWLMAVLCFVGVPLVAWLIRRGQEPQAAAATGAAGSTREPAKAAAK